MNNRDTCNICQLPVENCLNHQGVLSYYWNMHVDYDFYQAYLDNNKRKQQGLPVLETNLTPKPKTFVTT